MLSQGQTGPLLPCTFNRVPGTDPFSDSDTVLLRSSCDVPSSATANPPFARKVANVTSRQILAIYGGQVEEALPEPPTAHLLAP